MGEPDWPFIGSEALAAGQVSRRALRSHNEMVYRNVYVGKDQQVTPVSRAIAAWLWSVAPPPLPGCLRPRCTVRDGSIRVYRPS